MKKAINYLAKLVFILILLFGLCGIVLYAFGYRFYGITTGSMGEEFPVGSMVVVRPIALEEIRKGDVISYTIDENLSITTHRVERIEGEFVYTKGDNNNAYDQSPVYYENIVGKVILMIPLVGNVIIKCQTVIGRTIIVVVILLLLIDMFFRSKFLSKHKEGDISEDKNAEH